ncbi:MAG: lysophospholipid acyltransferase family protein [Peptostreptococcaceae bacterium]
MKFYDVFRGTLKVFSKTFYKFEVLGLENVPKDGNVIVAANHKSNLDPVFLASAMDTREVAGVAKKELFENKILGSILKGANTIPINRDNPDISTIKKILKAIKEGYIVAIFPEGTRCKDPGFSDAKAGLGMFAVKGKASVIPVSIITNYKLFNKVTLYFDKPISFEEYYGQKLNSKDYERLSQNVLEVIKENYYIYSN